MRRSPQGGGQQVEKHKEGAKAAERAETVRGATAPRPMIVVVFLVVVMPWHLPRLLSAPRSRTCPTEEETVHGWQFLRSSTITWGLFYRCLIRDHWEFISPNGSPYQTGNPHYGHFVDRYFEQLRICNYGI